VPLVLLPVVQVFGEEYGWRGYLLPKLLPLGERRASLIVGVVWGLWHFPNALGEASMVDALTVILFYVASNTALSPLFTRFFVSSGGSVAVVCVLHACFNAAGTLAFGLLVVDEFAFGGIVVIVIATAALVTYSRRVDAA